MRGRSKVLLAGGGGREFKLRIYYIDIRVILRGASLKN